MYMYMYAICSQLVDASCYNVVYQCWAIQCPQFTLTVAYDIQ